ncbi:MAG: hypothetical protein FWE20_09965 [Defluviitaleaceae bacterium]|nr:hypothetical protein [Defluviitaleaceae bacterium]
MTSLEQARKIISKLFSSGRLAHNEYVLLRDVLDEYNRIRNELAFAADKFKTERNSLEQSVIRFNVTIEDITEALDRNI